MTTVRKRIMLLASVSALLVSMTVSGSASQDSGYRIHWDHFHEDFNSDTENPSWFYFAVADPEFGLLFEGNDGEERNVSRGLNVRGSGTNAETGEPEFSLTLGQEFAADNPLSLPGGLDHVKWLAYMNHLSSNGIPGFDAVPGQVLSCETWMSATSYGVEDHPFGSAVTNPNDDLRLGAVAMNTLDLETMMVFDFFLTNEGIYAFYERLPFNWTEDDRYAAFSFQIRIGDRKPHQLHHLKISYDRSAGTVGYYVDDQEVFSVDEIGKLIDREYMVIDHGGDEEIVEMNQMNCGMGMFTLLDASEPGGGEGLVRLSTTPDFYYDPGVGESAPQTFVDEDSNPESRLWGQGAEFEMLMYVVDSR